MSLLKMGLSGLTPAELASKAATLEEKMDGNAYFPTPIPALADITAARGELRTAIDNAQWGDKQAVGVRNEKMNELSDLLRTLARYVSLTADGSRDMILSSGFDVRKQREPLTTLGSPVDFLATRSEKSGKIDLKWKPVSRSKAYQVEIADTDPRLPDTVWKTAAVTSRSNCLVSNLEGGVKYVFRVKAISGDMSSAYSDIALIMAA